VCVVTGLNCGFLKYSEKRGMTGDFIRHPYAPTPLQAVNALDFALLLFLKIASTNRKNAHKD
jgi:hypothetical protein